MAASWGAAFGSSWGSAFGSTSGGSSIPWGESWGESWGSSWGEAASPPTGSTIPWSTSWAGAWGDSWGVTSTPAPTPAPAPGGGWRPPRKYKGKDWKADDKRRAFWQEIEDELTQLASPESKSKNSSQNLATKTSLGVLESAGRDHSLSSLREASEDQPDAEETEFLEMIRIVTELL